MNVDTAAEPEIVTTGGSARRLRDAIEPLAMHAVWSPHTNERLGTLGLNFLTGYVWGRAASLGEPPAAAVVSAFGVFEPGFVTSLYEAGRAAVGRAEMVAVRDEATGRSLRDVLGDTDVTGTVAVLRRGIAAAESTGRPLFAGLAAQPWPDEPAGQLWRACDLLREHRGDGHLAACVAAGLDPVSMNLLTELYVGMPLFSYALTRGWSKKALRAAADRLRADGLLDGDRLTDAGRQLRRDIEERTDAAQTGVVNALGADLDATVARLHAWSAACVAAKTFPPDPLKRAAG